MNIIYKDCDPSLSKEKSLPVDSFIVLYVVNDEEKYDIVQASSFVEVFDFYYDKYGKNSIKSIKWTSGTINPRLYNYKSKDNKNKNKK